MRGAAAQHVRCVQVLTVTQGVLGPGKAGPLKLAVTARGPLARGGSDIACGETLSVSRTCNPGKTDQKP